MVDPADLDHFFAVFFSAAMVVLLGASYALLFALGQIKSQRHWLYLAYTSYVGLVVSTFVLANATHLTHHFFWISVVMIMLIGYFFAPHGIWYLCLHTHQEQSNHMFVIREEK